jgi:hypothetical protein
MEGLYKLRGGEVADVKPALDFETTGKHVGSTRKSGLLVEWDENGIAQRPRNMDLDLMEAVRPGEGQ